MKEAIFIILFGLGAVHFAVAGFLIVSVILSEPDKPSFWASVLIMIACLFWLPVVLISQTPKVIECIKYKWGRK